MFIVVLIRMIYSRYMELTLTTLNELSTDLFDTFLAEAEGEKNIFSRLASTQTGNDRTVSRERMEYVLGSHDHHMVLCLRDDIELVGMVLAQRVTGINNSYMYIHDIVVDPEARGGGIGGKLMEAVMDGGAKKWPEVVRIQLTSRPSRGTGPFFQTHGFRARTKETGDETVVYVKDIGDYKS